MRKNTRYTLYTEHIHIKHKHYSLLQAVAGQIVHVAQQDAVGGGKGRGAGEDVGLDNIFREGAMVSRRKK